MPLIAIETSFSRACFPKLSLPPYPSDGPKAAAAWAHTHMQTTVWFSCNDVFFFHLLCLFSPPQRQAKYSENKLKCTKARNDYLLNLAATNAVVAKYYIHDVSDMIDVSMH